MKKKQSFLKQLGKKYSSLKLRFMLLFVLPAFIIVLAMKVVNIFIKIKIKDVFTDPNTVKAVSLQKEAAQPVPATVQPIKKKIITPVPL